MFETSEVRARAFAVNRYPLLITSVALHSLAAVAVIVASIRSVSFPTAAPNEVAPIFLPTVPALPPPPLGRRDVPRDTPAATAQQPTTPRTASPAAITAPISIPDQVPVTTGDSGGTSDAGTGSGATGYGDPNGDVNGVDVGQNATVQAEPVQQTPYRPGGEVRAARVLKRVQPEYPRLALSARLQGYVIVSCVIDRNGRIRDAHVLRSSSPLFEQAALDAVQQWQFAPGVMRDEAVDTFFELTVNFATR